MNFKLVLYNLFLLVLISCKNDKNESNVSSLPKLLEIPTITNQQLDGSWCYINTISNFDYNSHAYNQKNQIDLEDYNIYLDFRNDSVKLYGYPYLRFYEVILSLNGKLLECKAETFVPIAPKSELFQFGDTLLLGYQLPNYWFTGENTNIRHETYYSVFYKSEINTDSLRYLDSCYFNWPLVYDKWKYGQGSSRSINLDTGVEYILPGELDLSATNKSNFSHSKNQLNYKWNNKEYLFEIFKKRQNILYLNYISDLDTVLMHYTRPANE